MLAAHAFPRLHLTAPTLAAIILICPLTKPQTSPVQPAFEVASIRIVPPARVGLTSISPPQASGFTAKNASLSLLIQIAFGIDENKIADHPAWLDSTYYDITAKTAGDLALTSEQLRPLLQHLLQQRLHLSTHSVIRDLPGYALVVARNGQKLHPASDTAEAHPYIFATQISAQNISMHTFAAILARPIGRPVADQTGLSGNFDIKLDFAPADATDSPLPPILTALQEQLGLKLESRKIPVKMLVIDRADRTPTEN